MNTLETIDRLCAVVREQADIIREQALFIEEQLTVDEATRGKFVEKREAVDSELALIEGGLPLFQLTNCGKEAETCTPLSEH